MTQYALSMACGIPQTTISAIVRAVHENPSVTAIWNIVTGLGIGMREFFDSPLFAYENIPD